MTNLFNRWFIQLTGYAQSEKGQTMAEYGIILVVLALAAAAAFGFLKNDITAALGKVGDKLNP